MITMRVKKENNQLTLPESVMNEFKDVECFSIVATSGAITLTPSSPMPPPRADGKSPIANLRGEGRGKVWMSDDFNETPEEFAEYM